jgi:hypothetical protein
LADFIQQKIEELGDEPAKQSGRMTFNDALAIFRQRLDGKQDIKEGAKIYRRKCIEALVKSWPELEEKLVSKVSKEECLAWARKFSSGYCPSVYNNTVGTLRMILDIAVEMGARAVSPHPSTPSYLPRRPDILLWGNGDGLGLVLEKVQDRVGPDLKTPAQGDELIAALS